MGDVGVVPDKLLGNRTVRRTEHQECPIDRVSQCPTKEQLASLMCFPDQL